MRTRPAPAASLAALLLAALSSSGCASMFLSRTEEVEVVTDPPGATASAGEYSVVTPGKLKVLRQKGEVVVRIAKTGYETRLVSMTFHRAGAIWTNIAFPFVGLAAGYVSDLNNGRTNVFDSSKNSSATDGAMVGAAIGAAVMAAGFTADLTSDRTWSPDRDSIVLKLAPVSGGAPAGGLR